MYGNSNQGEIYWVFLAGTDTGYGKKIKYKTIRPITILACLSCQTS